MWWKQKYVIKTSLPLSKTAFRFLDKFIRYYLDKLIYIKFSIKVEHSLSCVKVKPMSGQCSHFIPPKICVLGKLHGLCIDSLQWVKIHCNT